MYIRFKQYKNLTPKHKTIKTITEVSTSIRTISKTISLNIVVEILNSISEFEYSGRSSQNHLSRIVRKPDFCLGVNKGADQLRGNREADQRLCFRYTDSTISLLLKSEISSF